MEDGTLGKAELMVGMSVLVRMVGIANFHSQAQGLMNEGTLAHPNPLITLVPNSIGKSCLKRTNFLNKFCGSEQNSPSNLGQFS